MCKKTLKTQLYRSLDYDVTRRTRKENFLKQIDQLIDWSAIGRAIAVHYAPVSDATSHPAYSGLLLFKILLSVLLNKAGIQPGVVFMLTRHIAARNIVMLWKHVVLRTAFRIRLRRTIHWRGGSCNATDWSQRSVMLLNEPSAAWYAGLMPKFCVTVTWLSACLAHATGDGL